MLDVRHAASERPTNVTGLMIRDVAIWLPCPSSIDRTVGSPRTRAGEVT